MPAPHVQDTPFLRHLVFGEQGEGLVTYLVLEEQRRVDELRVLWLP